MAMTMTILTQIKLVDFGPCNPVAVIRRMPQELAAETGLMLETGCDDLDHYEAMALQTSNGIRFVLMRHRGYPDGMTDIRADHMDSRVPWPHLETVLAVLGLASSDVEWISCEPSETIPDNAGYRVVVPLDPKSARFVASACREAAKRESDDPADWNDNYLYDLIAERFEQAEAALYPGLNRILPGVARLGPVDDTQSD
jgi:hypothetical protein